MSNRENHGLSAMPEYRVWRGMKERCSIPSNGNFARYGGRGIKVCDRWIHSFSAFIEDMGRRPTPLHSIERKDNNGNYEPNNCKWATREEQMANRRDVLKIKNQTGKSVREWQELTGLTRPTILDRIKAGWSFEQLCQKNQQGIKGGILKQKEARE